MSSVKSADFLSLLTRDSVITSDVTIQFEDDTREINAHKQIFGLVSKVFENQFYGQMRQQARVTDHGEKLIILEKKFCYDVYYIFVRYIYGDEDILGNCWRHEHLFQLLEMAKLYMMPELETSVLAKITSLKITLLFLLPTLRIVQVYKDLDGFENICNKVNKKIVACFGSISVKEQSQFYRRHRKLFPDLVPVLMALMANERTGGAAAKPNHCLVDSNRFYKFYQLHCNNPDIVDVLDDIMCNFLLENADAARVDLEDQGITTCVNCRMPTERCKHGQLIEALPHVGLLFATEHGHRRRVNSVREVNFTADNGYLEAYVVTSSTINGSGGSFIEGYTKDDCFEDYTYFCE